MNEPIWLKVLMYYDSQRFIQNGLTIPFLIGAVQLINLEERLTVADLLREMASKNLSKKITIIKCGNVGEFVVGILDWETEKILMNRHIFQCFDNIYFPDNSFLDCHCLNDLISKLIPIYSPLISESLYSKENGVWCSISSLDTARINKLSISIKRIHSNKFIINKNEL